MTAIAGPVTAAPAETRGGITYWLASLRAMLRFDWARTREWAPMMVVMQLVMGAGMALLYGFFYPHVTAQTGLYITTGVPTLALIPLGFVMIPMTVAQQKLEGTFDFIWSLPGPRSAQATSTFLLYAALALPGTVLALVVSAWRYGVHLVISPDILPATLISAVTAITVGFGMALAIRNPTVTGVVTNTLIFVVLLFTPIVYPASNQPSWLVRVHEVLPFYNMAIVIRSGLTDGLTTGVGRAYLVLALWTVIGCALTGWVVKRRT